MEIDNYELWRPIADLPQSPYFFELHHATGELTILLKEYDNPDKAIKIKFT